MLSPNHVGFFLEFQGDRVILLGGNQSDRVDRTPFPKSQIVAARWLNLAPAQDAVAAAPGAAGTVGTLSNAQWATYLDKLGERESGNNYSAVNRLGYCGRWQFGAEALIDVGYVRKGSSNRSLLSPASWTGKDRVKSRADWLSRRDAQDAAMLAYTRAHYADLLEHGQVLPTSSPARVAGLLAAAHLMGLGGARKLVDGTVTHDANGTTTLKYYALLSVALGGTGRLEA